MSRTVCTKTEDQYTRTKNVFPQNKITIFGSLQSQKEMKLGSATINYVPVWLGVTHERGRVSERD
jgi:hypothetical protein